MKKILLVLIGLALSAPAVGAAQDAPATEVHIEAGGVTDFPLSIGVGGTLELPYRTRVGLSVGYLPEPYLGVINDIVVAVGGYDEKTAELIAVALGDSFIWTLKGGWMPLAGRGLFVDLGYRFIGLGGGVGQQTILSEATGYTIPGVEDTTLYDVDAQVHMASLDVGWRWLMMDDSLVLSAALGLTTTLAASATVDDRYGLSGAAGYIPGGSPELDSLREIAELNKTAEDLIVSSFEEHVHAPVVSVSLMYRLF